MNAGSPLVDVRAATKVYTPFPWWLRILVRSQVRSNLVALDGVSFRVDAGQICGVIGPNGAGKTTLFRILTGLTTPTSGSATIMGHDVTRESVQVRRYVGFMSADDRSLMLRQTCWSNLAFHGRLRGLREARLRRRIDELLELVGLTEARDRVGFALSSGMRARLQLARALLHEPQILILDEPTASVDPVSSHEFLGLLQRLATDQGVAVLVSSHRVEEIEALHDNVVLLDRGRLVHWGSLDALRTLWERPMLEISFTGKTAAATAGTLLRRNDGVEVVGQQDATLTVHADVPTGRVLAMLDGQLSRVVSVRERQMPLRQLIAVMTGGPNRGTGHGRGGIG
ncbi:MAG: ABC transporter ATP-binding protein [Actinomycetota bacterium]